MHRFITINLQKHRMGDASSAISPRNAFSPALKAVLNKPDGSKPIDGANLQPPVAYWKRLQVSAVKPPTKSWYVMAELLLTLSPGHKNQLSPHLSVARCMAKLRAKPGYSACAVFIHDELPPAGFPAPSKAQVEPPAGDQAGTL